MTASPPPAGARSRRSEERRIAAERSARWAAELAARFTAAATPEARARVLADMDGPYTLDEEAALALYRLHPDLTSAFIQRHLPRGRRAEDAASPWQRLMGQALARQDASLHFALYRIQAPAEQWARDTSALIHQVREPERLCAELQRRHPHRRRPDIGPQLAALAHERGEDLLPYLLEHAADVWQRGRREGYEPMLDLARHQGWWELWALLLRSAGTAAEYDREVLALVRERDVADAEIRLRLALLAGAGALAENPTRIKLLKEATLVALYERFPHITRGPFRSQIEPLVTRPLTGLLELAAARRDDELIDVLAARLAACVERSGGDRLMRSASLAADYLSSPAADAAAVSRRIVSILKRIPAHAMRAQRELLRRNPLARLLFERASQAALESFDLAAELMQAPNPHVRALGVRTLAAHASPDGPAQQRLESVFACLERQLPRTAARQALRALDRFADEPAQAQRVAEWIRGILAQPQWKGPRDELVALLARQLDRHPSLRHAGEHLVVHRRAHA